MTWIEKTSLAVTDDEATGKAVPTAAAQENSLQRVLPDLINNALASGAPVDAVQAWLKQCDFSKTENVREHFTDFLHSFGMADKENCQPMST